MDRLGFLVILFLIVSLELFHPLTMIIISVRSFLNLLALPLGMFSYMYSQDLILSIGVVLLNNSILSIDLHCYIVYSLIKHFLSFIQNFAYFY
jgi:hypothetical protein